MSLYFNKFPDIEYNGSTAKNITLRARVLDKFRLQSTNFYSYTVKDNETADSIAFDYYDDPNYVWLIYYCNDIIDPYHDWYMNSLVFDKYIEKKYGSVVAAMEEVLYYKKDPVVYYLSTTDNDYLREIEYDPNVHANSYERIEIDEDVKVSPDTFTVEGLSLTEWSPVDAYTYEIDQNEQKRFIKLLNSNLVPMVEKQLKDLLNG